MIFPFVVIGSVGESDEGLYTCTASTSKDQSDATGIPFHKCSNFTSLILYFFYFYHRFYFIKDSYFQLE